MLKATRLDRLIQQHNQYRQLLNSLTNQWLSYASHKETGLVYDIDIIKHHIETLSKEIDILEQELEKS